MRLLSHRLAAFVSAASLFFCPGAFRSMLAAENAAIPEVRWVFDAARPMSAMVEVRGLSKETLQGLTAPEVSAERWQEVLSVFADGKDLIASVELPPMLGTYRLKNEVLQFEPRFPLESGMTYRAVLKPGALGAGANRSITVRHVVPARKLIPTAVVQQVYPTADVLPENLLKFYLQFSAPMSRGHIYSHIHLLKSDGKSVDLPFLEIDEELWDPAMTRLTLFIDPGRIKRGVQPLEEIGPALETGKSYTLVIDAGWEDENGAPLKEAYRKTFKVGPPDRRPLDTAQWKVEVPASGTRGPLKVRFPTPMDHALAQRLITVTGPAGERREGKVSLTDQERTWSFVPAGDWKRGGHQLIVQTIIEDLAGNNIGKPFEVDVFENVQKQLTSPTVTLPFEVR